MIGSAKLHEGMIVHSADGARLGKVVDTRPDGFIVEKGLFLPKTTFFEYDDVEEIRGDDVRLTHARAQLSDESWWTKREQARSARAESALGRNGPPSNQPVTSRATVAVAAQPSARADAGATTASTSDEVNLALAEEEISAEKHTRDIGEVRVHKRVVVTQKQITVPVMHEEVRVERVATDGRPGQLSEGTFVESTVTIPLHAEEVEIHKRPVIREEIHVKKQTFQEEKTSTAEVRKEEVDIEGPTAPPIYTRQQQAQS